MAMAFMNVFDANVVQNIREFIPLPDITIRVLHENHPMALECNVYIYVVRTGTTVAGIKKKLLDARFRKFGWLPDEMTLRWGYFDLHELFELEYDATLMLNLYPIWREGDDDEESDGDDDEESEEDDD